MRRNVAAVLNQAAAYRQPSPARTSWPGQPATVPDLSGTGGNVTPRTATLYRVLATTGQLREGAADRR